MLIRFKDSIKVLLGIATAVPKENVRQSETDYYCPVCEKHVVDFLPLNFYYSKMLHKHGYIHPSYLSETINLFKYSCPKCFASDRDRLYALYLSKKNPIVNDSNYEFLDIAPSKALSNFIKKNYQGIKYRSADLMMPGVDDVVDITNMSMYSDAQFDFIMCSHVLEHIENDIAAIQEIYRVLKNSGKAIIMVPILLNLNQDYENPLAKTPEERWKHFGQDDHVRIYSKSGFIEKLTKTGFVVKQYTQNDFSIEDFQHMGIHERSVLYVVEKV